MAPTVPLCLATWLRPFRNLFTNAAWCHVLVLVAGTLLVPGRRTVTAALRVMGLDQTAGFAVYHRLLSTPRWSSRVAARQLLGWLVDTFVRDGPVVIGSDDTIERRWRARIRARGIYRDPVRSSRGCFVKVSGLRWLCLMVLTPVPWARSVWGLPFLSVLAPSERHAQARHCRHKKLTDWARQALLQTARWLPNRRVIAVADSSFAAIDLMRAVAPYLCLITRLRLDANLYDPPPPPRPGHRGRPRVLGAHLPSLADRLSDPTTRWIRVTIDGWYGKADRCLDIASGTALWNHGRRRVALRWVLVRDVLGDKPPQAFACTDLAVDPVAILSWFVWRWRTEVTFEEVRRHLGVETQRQWSDLAILRTTPALMGLFSLVTVWADLLRRDRPWALEVVSWYRKPDPTFSDALALVRYELWTAPTFNLSRADRDIVKIPRGQYDRLMALVCKPP